MADTFKAIPFDLGDGKERKLKYTGPSIIKVERSQSGRSILNLARDMLVNASVDMVSTFVWGGLVWSDPDLKVEVVQEAVFGNICKGVSLVEQLSPVIEALMECGLLKRREESGNGAVDPTNPDQASLSPEPSETGTTESNLN